MSVTYNVTLIFFQYVKLFHVSFQESFLLPSEEILVGKVMRLDTKIIQFTFKLDNLIYKQWRE